MAELIVQEVGSAGRDLTFTAANVGGDSFRNSGTETLVVKNAGAANITLTAITQVPSNHGTIVNAIYVVPFGAAKEFQIANLRPDRFNDGNGLCQLTYSSITSVTMAVVRQRGS